MKKRRRMLRAWRVDPDFEGVVEELEHDRVISADEASFLRDRSRYWLEV